MVSAMQARIYQLVSWNMQMRIVRANKTRWRTTFLLGLIHLLLYVRFILLVPILLKSPCETGWV